MKTIVVGINHAGTSAIRTLMAQNKDMEIIAYDRNDNISFLGCGIALTVSGVVKDPNSLFYCNPEKLMDKGASINMNHEVVAIDPQAKKVKVKNLANGQVFEETYDNLIYAAGSWPIDIPGIPEENANLENVEVCKLFQHAQELIRKADDPDIKKVTIVGSGYIGVELAEAYHIKGKQVTLIDFEDRILPSYFDEEFTSSVEADLRKDGLTLALGEKVVDLVGENGKVKRVITNKGEYEADLVIKCIGFKPNTELLPTAEKTSGGALIVDKHMRTSLPSIWAIGDSVAMYHAAYERNIQVSLATNAVKSGIVAASNINGNEAVKVDSIVGTNAIHVFGHKMASTGISEEAAKRQGIPVAVNYVEENDRPEWMEEYTTTKFKIVYEKDTLRLLGAQVASSHGESHTETIYYLALAIQRNLTLLDLAFTDVYFLPHFNKPFNFVLAAVMEALGLDYYKE